MHVRAFEMACTLSQQEAIARDFEGDICPFKKGPQNDGAVFGAIAGILSVTTLP